MNCAIVAVAGVKRDNSLITARDLIAASARKRQERGRTVHGTPRHTFGNAFPDFLFPVNPLLPLYTPPRELLVR